MISKCHYVWLIIYLLLTDQTNSEKNVENNAQEDLSTSSPSLAKETTNPPSEIDVELDTPEFEEYDVPQYYSGEIPNTTVTNDKSNNTDVDYEYVNSNTTTEITSEPSTLVPTTELPATTPSLPYQSEFVADDFCLCDLKVGFCDINCCCDEDCTTDDRTVFSHCQERPQNVLDPRYCFQKQIIFSNHTEYTVEYLQSGAFCIVTDNLPQRTTFTTVEGVTTVEEYQQLHRTTLHFPWQQQQQQDGLHFEESPYSDGSPVWALSEDGLLFNPGIPESVIGSECETRESLRFLKEVESSCVQVFHHVADDCQNNRDLNVKNYLSFSVLADPSRLNENSSTENPTDTPESTSSSSSGPPTPATEFSEAAQTELPSMDESIPSRALPEQYRGEFNINYEQNTDVELSDRALQDLGIASDVQLLPVTTFLCQLENSEEHCVETNINDLPQPVYTLGVCRNVMLSVQYTFQHNGTEGFSDVRAKVYLTNVSNTMAHLTQSFSAHYIWASTKDTVIFERSGRPGYLTGKPIILGKLVDNTTEEGAVKEAIYLDIDPGQWLTLLTTGKEGKCDARSQVSFGMEMRSGCIVDLMYEDLSHCTTLQQQFLDILLGPVLQDSSNLRVATFGDSSVNNVADWVPILVPEEPRVGAFLSDELGKRKCSEMILSLHIEVAYSLQGALANPQAKIVGVVLHYGVPQSIELSCVSMVCQTASSIQNQMLAVELVSSVSFVDVTKPPEPAYAQPPALDVKLPYDFFYPFLPSSAHRLSTKGMHFGVIICILWCLLLS